MSLLQAVVLGFVQGATEFLPISSSGHLVLVPWLLGWTLEPKTAFTFDVLVQWGTLLAVIVYFRDDLWRMTQAAVQGLRTGQPLHSAEARLAWLVLVAGIPATLIGVLLKRQVAAVFSNPAAVSLFLLLTATLIALSERLALHRKLLSAMPWVDAIAIGLAQALALLPGISRSGATIGAGLARGLERSESARFSFLIGIPVLIGAGLVAMVDLANVPNGLEHIETLFLGGLVATCIGYLALRWLIRYLTRKPLTLFAVYCAVVGTLGLLLSVMRA